MAMYFDGGGTPEIDSSHPNSDGFHTLYLLNPTTSTTSYVPYSHTTSPTPNMLLHNPNDSPVVDALNPHAPPSSSTFLPHDFSAFHGFPAPPPRTLHYNLWPSSISIDHHQPATASTSSGTGAGEVSPHMSFRRPSQQGLSLSLSSQQTANYRTTSSLSGELDVAAMSGGEDVRILAGNHHGSSFVLGSKYLKAAQEVLDEVVSMGKGIIQNSEYYSVEGKINKKANRESTSGGGNRDGSSSVGGGGENTAELVLTTAQRQELQMKKSKLITMIDEVEQRYRQYHHQMQVVISSLEQAVGYGGAKTYTWLALKTISKQFRCLKDAIASQVKATSKSLGEDDYCLGAKVEGGSRLKYVDHHLRQQRTLQHLGMMQPNAWRPQRGLPERAVSVLRAWLFEHFLHPYPKDSDKVMLAKQTGLTRSQVSNWFINARVRLWKPMVEEMYMEEMKKEQQQDGSHQENSRGKEEMAGPGTNNNNKESSSSQLPQDHDSGLLIHNHHHHHDMQITSPKKRRMNNSTSEILNNNNANQYASFSMEDIGSRFNNNVVSEQLGPRFHHGNAVSLTLGLPHNNNDNIGFMPSHNMSDHHHDATTEFCGMINTAPPLPSHASSTSTNYESNINIDMQNRKRFAAVQLLPDFVS